MSHPDSALYTAEIHALEGDLGPEPDAAAAASAARAAHARAEAANDAVSAAIVTDGKRIACRAGCAFCCYTLVSANEAEVFAISEHVETLPEVERGDLKSRVAAQAAKTAGKDGAWRWRTHTPCAFLDLKTKLCRIHEVRPMACRAMHSESRVACEKSWRKRDAYKGIPSYAAYFRRSHAVYAAFKAVFKRRGRALGTLDMPRALALLWRRPKTAQAWSAGEDAFGEAAIDRTPRA